MSTVISCCKDNYKAVRALISQQTVKALYLQERRKENQTHLFHSTFTNALEFPDFPIYGFAGEPWGTILHRSQFEVPERAEARVRFGASQRDVKLVDIQVEKGIKEQDGCEQ